MVALSNRITTIIDFVTDGASRQLSGFKAKIAEADTATGKMKAGFGATSDFIKANAASIATTAGAALIGFGAQAVKAFTETAIEADNLASLTGDTVEQSSRLNAIWKQSGADSKDLQDVLLQMNGVLSTNKGLVQQLGIDMSKSATVGQRFEEVAAALDQIPDAAKRSQIASQVFGEEGVRQYNALRTSVGDVSEAMAEVSDAQVIDEAEVDKARRLAETMKKAEKAIKDITMVVGEELAPELASAAENMLWLKERAEYRSRIARLGARGLCAVIRRSTSKRLRIHACPAPILVIERCPEANVILKVTLVLRIDKTACL